MRSRSLFQQFSFVVGNDVVTVCWLMLISVCLYSFFGNIPVKLFVVMDTQNKQKQIMIICVCLVLVLQGPQLKRILVILFFSCESK